MDIDKLVMMARQIERNLPAGDDVPSKLAAHLEAFWAPQMRTQLHRHVVANRADFGFQLQQALDELHHQAKA